MAQTAEWVPYVRDGRLRLLAVFTEDRQGLRCALAQGR
jgi:tripartite-type tricarboxylate transporter receptor subunit TctC